MAMAMAMEVMLMMLVMMMMKVMMVMVKMMMTVTMLMVEMAMTVMMVMVKMANMMLMMMIVEVAGPEACSHIYQYEFFDRLVGRSQERGAAIVEELQKTASQQGAASDGSVYTFRALDAFSMPACRALADDLLRSEAPLDYLVLTQGMATLQGYTPTAPEKGGLDEKLTLHYYSRALLMDSLAPLLQKSSDGRCLSVLSGGIHSAYAGYVEDPDLSKSYSLTKAANLAGFYNDIAVDALSSAYPGVSFMHAAPGFVATSWGTEMPPFVKALVRLLQNLGRSKEDAAEYMFRSLYHDDFKGGGFYIVNQYGESTETLTSLHKEAKDAVWSHSKEILAKF
ncbi:notO [Symbiodinium necroappetens]|uniref:NotO protein n=1 Tax=Symbiodinium necroappetens TaxID=1628268 RepID=A0A812S085_9DINO|nr:notO [Symbiodinium necroappetens]